MAFLGSAFVFGDRLNFYDCFVELVGPAAEPSARHRTILHEGFAESLISLTSEVDLPDIQTVGWGVWLFCVFGLAPPGAQPPGSGDSLLRLSERLGRSIGSLRSLCQQVVKHRELGLVVGFEHPLGPSDEIGLAHSNGALLPDEAWCLGCQLLTPLLELLG